MALLLLAVALLAIEFGYYRQKARQVREQQHQFIAAIGTLKAGQIQSWRRERLEDAWRVARGPVMRHRTAELLRNRHAPEVRADLLELLQLNRMSNVYASTHLLSLEGRILLSTDSPAMPVEAATRRALAAAEGSQDPVISEFFRNPDGSTGIDVLATVRDDESGRPLAVVVLRCNADRDLFPLIQEWPVPSRSAETLLVLRSGDEVLSPHRLRHEASDPDVRRALVARTERPSVQAVLGRLGAYDSIDYRGARVLADLRPVPASPWFIVSKMDEEEALAHLHSNALSVLVITGAFLLLTGAGFAYFHRRRQAQAYRDLFESERLKLVAERSLRLSVERYRNLVESSQDLITQVDPAVRFTFVNGAAQGVFGLAPGECLGLSAFEFVHPEDLDATRKAFHDLLQLGHARLTFENRQVSRDGSVSLVQWNISLEHDDAGQVTGFSSIGRDVTRLREQERLLNDSQSIAHVGSWMLEVATSRLTWSRETFHLYGLDPARQQPPPYSLLPEFLHPEDRPAMAAWMESILTGRETPGLEFRTLPQGGGTRWLFSHGVLEQGACGERLRVVGSVMDISEHKRKEQLLAASHEHLRTLLTRLQRAQEDERIRVSREIHDDLGQLLTGLKMDVHWLERRLSEPGLPPTLNPLLDRVVGSSELVDTMVATVQRISAELRPTTLDKLGLEASLCLEARRFQDRSGVHCRVAEAAVFPELAPETASDVFYICREALTNVGRHAQANRVEICWRIEDLTAVFEVSDDGVGITEADLAAHGSLGLIGMRERALQCQGSIRIEAGEPRGTRVTVRVPCATAVEAERVTC